MSDTRKTDTPFLVALSLLLGVPVGDVLVSSSKVASPQNQKGTTQQEDRLSYVYSVKLDECLPVRETFVPPLLGKYLKSDYFKSQAYGDLILHAAAVKSLDLTIVRLGQERFQTALKEYQRWKERERQYCAARVQFPCSSDGVPQLEVSEKDCYSNDFGCGYPCIDEMLAK